MITTILTIVIIVVIFILLYKLFKLIVSVLLVALFLFIAYVTNPSLETHREAVDLKFGSKAADQITVDDFYVFSLTQTTSGKEVIGAGAFTQVFIFGSVD